MGRSFGWCIITSSQSSSSVQFFTKGPKQSHQTKALCPLAYLRRRPGTRGLHCCCSLALASARSGSGECVPFSCSSAALADASQWRPGPSTRSLLAWTSTTCSSTPASCGERCVSTRRRAGRAFRALVPVLALGFRALCAVPGAVPDSVAHKMVSHCGGGSGVR